MLAILLAFAGFANAQPAPPRVVWVTPVPIGQSGLFFEELRRGLRDVGYVEGSSIRLEPSFGDGSQERATKQLADVIASAPAVIVAAGSTGPMVVKMTTTIPVVFGYSGDPVEAGMVDSLPRPGRNLTGISYMALDLVGKRMEMLKELLPKAKRIAVVASPGHPGDSSERRAAQIAATKLGITIDYFEIGRGVSVADVLPAVENARSDAVVFFPTQTVIANRTLIAEWSQKRKLPTMSGWAQFADGGNVLSYGPNLADASRRLAFYVDRILKGAKPGDLPVEQPSRVELVINLKTARAIGLSVPNSLLVRADRVIE